MLRSASAEVRLAAVRSITEIGTQRSLDPLLQATKDNDPEVQIRAVDGIVNFYLPGYIQTGLARWSSAVKGRFQKENDQVIDPYVAVREDATVAIGRLARGGASMESRANAARALGILRGKAAVPDLLQALQSKNDDVIFESLIAFQKIRDTSAGPKMLFLLRDLQERVQVAAIETVGLLGTREAVPELQRAFNNGRTDRVRRAALTALAMLPDPSSRPLLVRGFDAKDDGTRAAAAEGFGRLGDKANVDLLTKAFAEEKKMPPRLAQAFALVLLGNRGVDEFSPFLYLVNTLNSRSYRGVAEGYLVELSRQAEIREALYPLLPRATSDEKIGLARILSVSGDAGSIPALERLSKDADNQVAQESMRALRSLKARI